MCADVRMHMLDTDIVGKLQNLFRALVPLLLQIQWAKSITRALIAHPNFVADILRSRGVHRDVRNL